MTGCVVLFTTNGVLTFEAAASVVATTTEVEVKDASGTVLGGCHLAEFIKAELV